MSMYDSRIVCSTLISAVQAVFRATKGEVWLQVKVTLLTIHILLTKQTEENTELPLYDYIHTTKGFGGILSNLCIFTTPSARDGQARKAAQVKQKYTIKIK